MQQFESLNKTLNLAIQVILTMLAKLRNKLPKILSINFKIRGSHLLVLRRAEELFSSQHSWCRIGTWDHRKLDDNKQSKAQQRRKNLGVA